VTYKNGDKYGGEWQHGKRHGNGTLWVLQEGKYNVRYSGDWQHDLPEVGGAACAAGWGGDGVGDWRGRCAGQ
jgi:hypothetical protein